MEESGREGEGQLRAEKRTTQPKKAKRCGDDRKKWRRGFSKTSTKRIFKDLDHADFWITQRSKLLKAAKQRMFVPSTRSGCSCWMTHHCLEARTLENLTRRSSPWRAENPESAPYRFGRQIQWWDDMWSIRRVFFGFPKFLLIPLPFYELQMSRQSTPFVQQLLFPPTCYFLFVRNITLREGGHQLNVTNVQLVILRGFSADQVFELCSLTLTQ